jgi:hypothetical protein
VVLGEALVISHNGRLNYLIQAEIERISDENSPRLFSLLLHFNYNEYSLVSGDCTLSKVS